MKFTRIAPGRYTGTDGTHTVTINRVREGVLRFAEWMWVARVDGEWITNADTLADAKAAVIAKVANP
jgi:hypothetical protein